MKYKICNSFWERARGFIGLKEPVDYALLFPKEKCVHMFFMRMPLLIIALDTDNRILDTYILKPWQIGKWHAQAAAILEISDLRFTKHCLIGKRLTLTPY